MKIKILFAGGGTAGHVEPALAVATWLQANRPEWQITFVGTRNGLENQLVPRAGFDLLHIPKVLMPRQLTPGIILWPFKMLIATIESIKICRKSELVIGFGGYACPPIYIAAALLRKPIFIHEANAIPGWANRLGAPFATQIFMDSMVAINILTGHRMIPGVTCLGIKTFGMCNRSKPALGTS